MNTAQANQTAQTIAQAEEWKTALHTVLARFDQHFTRSELRRRVAAYVQTLILPLERKNGWQTAEASGDKTPYGVQNLLGRADAVRQRGARRFNRLRGRIFGRVGSGVGD